MFNILNKSHSENLQILIFMHMLSFPALSEAQEELQAQILTRGVEEGRSLLDGVSGPLVGTNSLAHELSQMSDDEVNIYKQLLLTILLNRSQVIWDRRSIILFFHTFLNSHLSSLFTQPILLIPTSTYKSHHFFGYMLLPSNYMAISGKMISLIPGKTISLHSK